MALAYRASTTPSRLPPLPGLVVREERRPEAMSLLQGRSREAIERRYAEGHAAYVALHHGELAAWGWVARERAEIGELGIRFRLPTGDRYLWNFVTRPGYRGRGIYPALLDAVVTAESPAAERFWIIWAPENHASERGVRKAGFTPVAELSFDATGGPALHPLPGAPEGHPLPVPSTAEPLSPCWRCARAGHSGACSPGRCRCDYQLPERSCA